MVGTNSKQLQRLNTINLKLTNPTSYNYQKKQTSLFLEVVKIIGVVTIAAAASAILTPATTSLLVSVGVASSPALVTGYFVSATAEFAILQGYDAINGTTTKFGTFLNALPYLNALSAVNKVNKIEKIFLLAKETNIFKDLGIAEKEFRNLEELSKVLKGNRYFVGKTVYDFRNSASTSDILQLFADYSATKGISSISKSIKSGTNIITSDIDQLIELTDALRKISPQLYSKNVPQEYFKQAKELIKESKFKTKDLLDDKKFLELVASSTTVKGNKSANLIWALYSLRTTAAIEKNLSTMIVRGIRNTNNFLRKINPLNLLAKAVKETTVIWITPIKKILEKPSIWSKTKYAKFIEEINFKSTGKSGIKLTYEELEKILIPVDSTWILGYKTKPMPDGTFLTMIYFQNQKYEPRLFYFNQLEMTEWINACVNAQAGEYYKANLEFGYNLNFFGLARIVKYFPPAAAAFVQSSLRTWNIIQQNKKTIQQIKSGEIFEVAKNQSYKKIKTTGLNEALSLLFFGSLGKAVTRSLITKHKLSPIAKIYTNNYVKKPINKRTNKQFRVIK